MYRGGVSKFNRRCQPLGLLLLSTNSRAPTALRSACPGTNATGHGLVHQRYKPLVVVPFKQMDKFVDQDVLQALNRAFGQFQIEPNAACRGGATAPLRPHFLDTPGGSLHPDNGLPLLQKRRQEELELLPIPVVQDDFTLGGRGPWANRGRRPVPRRGSRLFFRVSPSGASRGER